MKKTIIIIIILMLLSTIPASSKWVRPKGTTDDAMYFNLHSNPNPSVQYNLSQFNISNYTLDVTTGRKFILTSEEVS